MEKTSRLTLREMYEVGGEIHMRYVDVLTESEIPNLMVRCQAAARALCAAVDQSAHEISAIVDEQRSRQQRLDHEELADSFERSL